MNRTPQFEMWKSALRKNCQHEGTLPAFNCIDDYVLFLLFVQNIAPTSKAIIANGQRVA